MLLKLAWLFLALVMWILVLLLVPHRRLGSLLESGLVVGFGQALVIQLLGQNLLGLWQNAHVFIPLWGIPLFLPVAYWAEVMLFLAYWPREGWARFLYFLVFCALNTGIDWFFRRLGVRVFLHWSLVGTFALAVVTHLLALLYHFGIRRQEGF